MRCSIDLAAAIRLKKVAFKTLSVFQKLEKQAPKFVTFGKPEGSTPALVVPQTTKGILKETVSSGASLAIKRKSPQMIPTEIIDIKLPAETVKKVAKETKTYAPASKRFSAGVNFTPTMSSTPMNKKIPMKSSPEVDLNSRFILSSNNISEVPDEIFGTSPTVTVIQEERRSFPKVSKRFSDGVNFASTMVSTPMDKILNFNISTKVPDGAWALSPSVTVKKETRSFSQVSKRFSDGVKFAPTMVSTPMNKLAMKGPPQANLNSRFILPSCISISEVSSKSLSAISMIQKPLENEMKSFFVYSDTKDLNIKVPAKWSKDQLNKLNKHQYGDDVCFVAKSEVIDDDETSLVDQSLLNT